MAKSVKREEQPVPRITMCFTTENRDYIEVMARARGESMAAFVNHLIEADREQRGDAYQKIKDALQSLED